MFQHFFRLRIHVFILSKYVKCNSTYRSQIICQCNIPLFKFYQLICICYCYLIKEFYFNSDAVKKRKVVCPMNSVLCHDGTHCVERTKFCDKTNDCSDSSDELFCGKVMCTSINFENKWK